MWQIRRNLIYLSDDFERHQRAIFPSIFSCSNLVLIGYCEKYEYDLELKNALFAGFAGREDVNLDGTIDGVTVAELKPFSQVVIRAQLRRSS